MAYNAAVSVAPLEWEFRPFIEQGGITPEPTKNQLKAYWSGLGRMLRQHRTELSRWEAKRRSILDAPVLTTEDSATDLSGRDEKLTAFDEEFSAWSDANGDEQYAARIELLAAVCSQCPSAEILTSLPGRVFDDYERHMQEELNPLGSRSASS